MSNSIRVVVQGFYGNRTSLIIGQGNLDRVLQGVLSDEFSLDYDIDRTIIEVPDTDGLVIIYNKYQEEDTRKSRYFNEERPLCAIPEKGVKIYSRCIACRLDESGEPVSIKYEDYDIILKYFME